ncbi:DUF732 domain-containing protein [Mycobacterium montefiorense]|uniref:DUF732 domain-containing protein n=1 Tax=Mycobacterium montefiorense TaxID=154654 RepID=UPI000D59BB80|nr:DUF732 domain-containing protein [Mycobacterium montefiorense]
MRDREAIESELRRIAAQGGQPSSREADKLLDELLAHSSGTPLPDAASPDEIVYVPDSWLREPKTDKTTPRRTKGARRRLSLFAALPLSLIAVFAAVVVMFAAHHQSSPEQSAETPPSAVPPKPPVPTKPPAPKPLAPRIDMVDMVFIATLKQEGIPVPSQEYVMAQGHAVCDFLARQPNLAEAVGFVQRSSIWDANQSADVTAGAIVSYCPQSRPSMADEVPAYQNTLSDMQAIEGKLQGIQDDLHGIQGGLDGLPGHP